jgi:hypothetical protein
VPARIPATIFVLESLRAAVGNNFEAATILEGIAGAYVTE